MAENLKGSFPTETSRFKRIRLWKIGDLVWDWAQLKVCGDQSWDAVVMVWNTRYLSLVPAILRAKMNGIPVILWGHGYSKRRGFFRDRVRNLVTVFADAVLFYDPLSRAQACGSGDRENYFVAPNAIDQTPITQQKKNWLADDRNLSEFKKQHNLEDREIVLFVSRIEPKNRLDVLLRGIAKAKSKHPDILLAVIGGGNKEQVDTLRDLARQLDIETNVHFLGSIYEEHEIAPWFLVSKIFCYPSNIGLSLMHAFGYGLPALIGDDFSKCNPEIYAFEPGINGMTFKDGDSDDLAIQICKLFEDADLQQTLGRNAAKTAAETATLENMVAGIEEAILFVVNKSKKEVMV